MADSNVVDGARYREQEDVYWCEACERAHEGAGPEHVGEGYHEDDVSREGDWYFMGTDYSTTLYRCANEVLITEEDWYIPDDCWECTSCGTWYVIADHASAQEAKEAAQTCCGGAITRDAVIDMPAKIDVVINGSFIAAEDVTAAAFS